MDLLPEDLELAHLQKVCQVQDILDLGVLQELLGQEALAQNEVCVREIGQRLQKDLVKEIILSFL